MPLDSSPVAIWLQRALVLLPVLGVVAVVAYNAFFWYRYASVEAIFSHMTEGSCMIQSPQDYEVPLLRLKRYYYYPLSGSLGMANSSWTEVPCNAHLAVFNAQGTEIRTRPGRTLILFTYWQSFVIDVVHDTCSRLIPKEVGRFSCCFTENEHGVVSDGVYVGSKQSLPDYPRLFLMKAAGLSTCTLVPVALLIFCCAKGALKRRGTAQLREVRSADANSTCQPFLSSI
mmetsp:Transcript_34231/g.94563  ORF Transcript_34231/g.94563 Transcript_34231/m.94563 type:complete len:229 (-) Transcript_34231:58-744(-)|eukprot:CAMPEP_0179024782 /NCGR_PEP_ID=MMETSP0796-20121207/7632_1 /TAXON_ID=73915 /ORGANISM="Pyrodinium bahamense, Strain pbaha01" /LENGTH=228 /DNA_ID=CAMNT_0020720753 /DNA_START=60 /DNA_END=746 /DNA_ORIENTATION=+